MEQVEKTTLGRIIMTIIGNRKYVLPSLFIISDRVNLGLIYPLVMTNITIENHHVLWENPHFKWPFSIPMFVYQRVSLLYFYGQPNLAGGFNPIEKYESIGMIIPNIWKNKRCS